jgi:hypothetical protein
MERMVSAAGNVDLNHLVRGERNDASCGEEAGGVGNAAKDLEHDRDVW